MNGGEVTQEDQDTVFGLCRQMRRRNHGTLQYSAISQSSWLRCWDGSV